MDEYFYGITDKGKCREKNEDTFFVREVINRQFIVAGVIDGVGGYQGGDIAAAIARSVILKHLETLSKDIIETLQRAIVAANDKINQEKEASGKNKRMACVLTCAVADIKNNKFWYAHVGDTRIYLLRDQSLVKISKDHSAVGFMEESGRLTEEEAMRHPRRNEINKALGFDEDITTAVDFIETGESPFLPGDVLLLCSDGLTDMIPSATIISVLTTAQSLAAKVKILIDTANDAGGTDNITAVLVENNKQPKQAITPVPVKRKKEAVPQAVANNRMPEPDIARTKRNGRNRIAFLVLVFIGLLGIVLTIAFTKSSHPSAKYILPLQAVKNKNEQLVQLISSLADSTKMVAFTGKGIVIELAEPVTISKDSFHLKGNGATFVGDSLFTGPAFIIHATSRHIILDSLVLKNFDFGIVVHRNNITFRNVRFVNCRIPAQYAISFPDTVVSGRLRDSVFINLTKPK